MDPLKLNVVELGHNTEAQRLFDDPKTRVGWGTQFLLASGILNGRWKWIDVIQKIDQLSGTDSQKLHLVTKIMLNQDQGLEDAKIGQELDREQKALVENKGRGLGLLNEGTDWLGGKIQFITCLEKKGDAYGFQLEPIEMKRSHRFARMFGSRRFLQIKLGRLYLNDRDGVKAFLAQRFVLNGRVFVTIPPTKDTLYAFEINENYCRQDIPELGDHLRWSLGKFLDWHNPIELNGHQPLAKYFSRTGLGFSKSVPALEFSPQNILDLNDVFTDDVPPGKAPAEKTLTDGCGFINFAALSRITENFGYKSIPSAIQGRIAGAKGLWILHPDDGHTEPKIWIRNSQRKIKYEKLDRAHCIIDLLKASQPSFQITLSSQTVVNLSHNSVPHSVFKDLMKSGIEELVRVLTAWGSDRMDMPTLRHAVGHTSGAPRSRLARLASDMSRALGYASWEPESSMEQNAAEISEQESPSPSGNGRDPYSGMPHSLGEAVMEMLQAGFHPNECPQLVDKIKSVIRNALDRVIEKCHIPLPEGTGFDGFAIPGEPGGVLEPGEIYYRSSTGYIDPATKMMQTKNEGDLFMNYSHPVVLPSDIQKVTFVDKPELVKWQDVIVISTKPIVDKRKGKVGGMSILSGGDTLFAIQLPELVNPFRNKTLSYLVEDVEINFERNVAVASQFVARLQAESNGEAQRRFQLTSFSGLADHRLGYYNSFASAAAKRHGYGSDEAIRLTYMYVPSIMSLEIDMCFEAIELPLEDVVGIF
ncbi:hypothetical protein L218DRAFT_862225 [Marasmius fiardii PR-910]|nr:hypothetical protein L218DRAFT_862225 [Marasmius fiardii PR-910]